MRNTVLGHKNEKYLKPTSFYSLIFPCITEQNRIFPFPLNLQPAESLQSEATVDISAKPHSPANAGSEGQPCRFLCWRSCTVSHPSWPWWGQEDSCRVSLELCVSLPFLTLALFHLAPASN